MKTVKSNAQLLSEARQLEEASRLSEAAGAYQQVVDADPTDQKALPRLLTLYRRLKEPKKELAVIEAALAAYAQRDKTTQEKWISTHPQAAKTSRAFLRSLGGSSISSFGSNPVVARLQKRREAVNKKLHGKGKSKGKAKSPPNAAAKAASAKKSAAIAKRSAAKAKRAEARQQAAEQKRQAAEARTQAAAARKQAAQQKRSAAAAARKAAAEEKAARKASLFIISLRYLALSEKISVAMPKHTTFLDKYFAAGDFLVAGRQQPPTGDIIIARGKNRAAIERIMHQAPLVKSKLASIDIVEFTPDAPPAGRPQSTAGTFGLVR